ncbi:MAG TPA: endolytic transglycosylase MltG [Vicinamibacterales bacterium]|nr:endolytic transglycosylase MltG [Vicinamibacterales bacterium]
MKKLLALIVLLVVVAAAAAAWAYARARAPYQGFTGSEQFVEIPPGAGSRTIGDRLVQGGVVRDHLTFRIALWLTGQGRRLKAGEYRFDHPMTPAEVIDKIARGDVFVIHVTFPEGLTSFEMAKIFESHGLGSAASFIAAASDASPVRAIDPEAKTLEGYLFPETYAVPRRTDASKLVRLMVAQFEHAWTPELRAAAAARHLTPHDAVTLASIVEKETAQPAERPTVAAVYENRLRIGMPLQCDPTVIYALERAGTYDGNIHKADLSIDSPYNTYKHPGLPPGPIASPGRASLDAAVHPADADYLYFVSRNDGTHVFSRTLDEHNRNVQRFQIEYFREKRQHSGHD